jgi:hypothetical protein
MDNKERGRLAKLLNMLRSPVAGERDAAVTRLNAIASKWNHDCEAVLAGGDSSGLQWWANRYRRTAPVFRPMTPEEKVLVGEMLVFGQRQEHWNRWLSDSDKKMLRVLARRGTITEKAGQ